VFVFLDAHITSPSPPAPPPTHTTRTPIQCQLCDLSIQQQDIERILEQQKEQARRDQIDELLSFGPVMPGVQSETETKAMEQLKKAREALAKIRTDHDRATKAAAAAPKRESWMTALPPEHMADLRGLDMKSRSFSSKGPAAATDSAWTDTPQERARQAAQRRAETAVVCVMLSRACVSVV
jgi:Protein of unknown function (DUF3752)